MLSSRQISIIHLLQNQTGKQYITMKQIACELGVSSKTVRNDIERIREYCLNHHLGEVITKPHAGVKIEMEEASWEQHRRELEGLSFGLLPETDISYTIIQLLLKRKTVTFYDLEKKLYVGRSTIEKVLPIVKQWFQNRNILCEKKRGKGIEITYTEFHWRMAMWHFLDYSKQYMKKEKTEKIIPEDELIDMLLDGFNRNGIEQGIRSLEKEHGIIWGYEAHLQMAFLLSLSIIRIRKKKYVHMMEVVTSKIDSIYDFCLMEEMVACLEKYYGLQIPGEEKEFILFVIRISDIQSFSSELDKQKFQIENLELSYITMKLINLLGEIINMDLKSDSFFIDHFFIQLRSSIQRLKYHIFWSHPLLKQVKQKYPSIYAAIYAAGVFFNKELGLEINENEMCCMALLLGGALERNITILTACVVCNYGIGVSQLLKERIERNITDLKILEVFSVRDMPKIRSIQCDFIISTLALEEFTGGKDVVVVEHLLPAYDVKKIGDKMQQIRKDKLKTKSSCNVLQLQKELFNKEFIWINEQVESKDQIIHNMCKALMDAGYVTEEFERSVLEHEEMAPTNLEKGVAIPHGFAKYVIRPVVAYASLSEPVIWHSNEKVDMVFMLAFNLDEASGLKEETIKFYGVFLDLLDNTQELYKVKHMIDKKEIVKFINQKIRGEISL